MEELNNFGLTDILSLGFKVSAINYGFTTKNVLCLPIFQVNVLHFFNFGELMIVD